MGKRKRLTEEEDCLPTTTRTSIQIITGSYERVLHGITASIPATFSKQDNITNPPETPRFADTFLFHAHTSAIRCLALSPQTPSEDSKHPQKVILASGSNDERINLYQLSATAPREKKDQENSSVAAFASILATDGSRNRELGSLLHHSSGISALCFPTKSKLLSASEDNTIAVTRTRDWTALTTIKVPIPKAVGRPSGDTAPLGGTPAGVNDFAIHPSLKVMISVGKGEKCMRLWNLVTGKKAGVLSFERDLLKQISESKWGGGEGQKVEWDPTGDEFTVVFERGAVVFGMDCKPKCVILPSQKAKLHQIRYITRDVSDSFASHLLSISTEDGRILFYPTGSAGAAAGSVSAQEQSIPVCEPLAQLGGKASGLTMRVKDYEILRVPTGEVGHSDFVIVAGSSDGSIRIWSLDGEELQSRTNADLVNGSSDSSIDALGKKIPELNGRHDAKSSSKTATGQVMGADPQPNSEHQVNGTANPPPDTPAENPVEPNDVPKSSGSSKSVNGDNQINSRAQPGSNVSVESSSVKASNGPEIPPIRQVGRLLGTCETGHRIICLKAFLLHDKSEGIEDDESEEGANEEFKGIESSGEEDSNSC